MEESGRAFLTRNPSGSFGILLVLFLLVADLARTTSALSAGGSKHGHEDGSLRGKGIGSGHGQHTCQGQGADRVAVMMMVIMMMIFQRTVHPISANKPVRVPSSKFQRMQRLS